MAEIVLFGGTTEGRELAEALRAKEISALVCVATQYGESLLPAGGSLRVHAGRLDLAAMTALLRAESPRLVLDATHPYAAAVSDSAARACEAAGVPYRRVLRGESGGDGGDCVPLADTEEMIAWLASHEGVVFSSLGSKAAKDLCRVPGFEKRIWLRILPTEQSLRDCLEAGFPPAHIICMQGPFSRELNAAMFRAAGAEILLTKESGAAGGFPEKLAAARDCGMTAAVLARPRERAGLTAAQWLRRIEEGTL